MRKSSWRYDTLIFDFDGVLVESNEIRFAAFQHLFSAYPEMAVVELMKFVRANGGLSRYKKIDHFFRNILQNSIGEFQIQSLAAEYSNLVKERVTTAPAVEGSVEFLQAHQKYLTFALVSGSDQVELHDICRARSIDDFFTDILGSPTEKTVNLNTLLSKTGWDKKRCLYVGDSMNDYHAARMAGIDFIGRNSGLAAWRFLGIVPWIDHLGMLPKHLSY